MKRHTKTLSLEDLTLHQQRIRGIVQKINEYSPTFHINNNYHPSKIIQKLLQQREQYEDKLFEQNMKMIGRIESVQSRVDVRHFPEVNLRARQKRKCSSLSQKKLKLSTKRKKYQTKNEVTIFEENMQMIDKLQTVDKKIRCWQDKQLIKSLRQQQKREDKKRKQILNKFSEISKQLSRLKVKKHYQKNIQVSPYLKKQQHFMRTNTRDSSFSIKKPKISLKKH